METNRRFTLDASVWRSDDGRTLIGGSDFTIVRLDDGQRAALNQLLSGFDPQPDPSGAYVQFLSDRNLIQPVLVPAGRAEVSVVIPCRDQQTELGNLLERLDVSTFVEIVVVDDGSTPPLVVPDDSVRVIRHETPLGPGAARDTGWRSTRAGTVLFLDADVITEGTWVQDALGYLSDPNVAAVAPRVRSIPEDSRAGRWEQVRPALDLGRERSTVRPRTRVPYVPTAALLVRRDALSSVGGFDSSLHLGEDVDLVWRLHDQGWTVRYEPGFEVGHLPRPTIRAWVSQRVTYGRSNVVLAQGHPTHVVGLELTWWNASPLLLLTRSPLMHTLGIAGTAAGLFLLRNHLADRCSQPPELALQLERDGVAYAVLAVAQGARRTYWPVTVLASLISPRCRLIAALSLLTPGLEWLRRRPESPLREWMTACLADDVSFGAGLWLESIRSHTTRALRVQSNPIERFLPDHAPGVNRPRLH